MKNCQHYEELFPEALYGELDTEERAAFDAHLATCTACAKAFAQMQKTLTLMSQHERPEPDSDYWDTYWEKLAPQLSTTNPETSEQTETAPKGWRVHRRLFIQLASAAAILLIGVYIGYQTGKTPDQSSLVKSTAPSAENAQFVQNYLSRSEALLLGLVHLDVEQIDPQAIDLNHIKNASRQLVREANLLRPQLTPDQQELQNLISDLELILMQISNLEAEQDIPGIDLIQSSVNRKSLLLRINLEELQQINTNPSPDNTNPSQI